MSIRVAKILGNTVLAVSLLAASLFCWASGWNEAGGWLMLLAVLATFSV